MKPKSWLNTHTYIWEA